MENANNNNNQQPMAKLISALIAAVAVGFGGATINFNASASDYDVKDCLVVIDKLIESHDGDLDTVAKLLSEK